MITFQTITVLAGAILVLMVPATRTELRNTRESPLRPIGALETIVATGAGRVVSLMPPTSGGQRAFRQWTVDVARARATGAVVELVMPYDPPTTGYRPQRRPAKRRIPAGHGHSQLGHGPLAWIWAELDPDQYPARRAADGILCRAT